MRRIVGVIGLCCQEGVDGRPPPLRRHAPWFGNAAREDEDLTEIMESTSAASRIPRAIPAGPRSGDYSEFQECHRNQPGQEKSSPLLVAQGWLNPRWCEEATPKASGPVYCGQSA